MTDISHTLRFPKPGTVPFAAQCLGISIPSTYKLIHQGKLRTYTVGRARRVTDQAIHACIALLENEQAVQSRDAA